MNSIHTSLAKAGFVRPDGERIIGGVCSGIARRYGLDAWAVRALLILTLLLLPGSQLLVYPVAWVLMPSEAVARRTAHTEPPAPAGYGDVPQDTVIR